MRYYKLYLNKKLGGIEMNNKSIHQRISYYAQTSIEKLYQDLNISKDGYDEDQVVSSREKYGSNVLVRKKDDTVFYRLCKAFINPFTIILFIIAIISFIVDVWLVSNYSRNMTTVILILCMILISGIIRFFQEMKAKKASHQLSSLFDDQIAVLRGGQWQKIKSDDLVVGDRVSLTTGERIPADIRLIEAKHLFVSQAVITGESVISEKNAEMLPTVKNYTYEEYSNILFMGSSIISGKAIGIVLAVGQDSVYGGISLTQSTRKDSFDQGANSIAWVLIRFMIVLIPIVFISCGLTKDNWIFALLFSLSVAVGLTPEMLPMVINACLAKGSVSMEKKQTVVKNINAMQTFGSMDVLCVDKTGTLTGDKIVLEYFLDILGNESRKVLEFGYLTSLYQEEKHSHIDKAILEYKNNPEYKDHFLKLESQYSKIDDLPFHYERKYSGVLVKNQKQNLIIIKGSVDEVFKHCKYVEYKDEYKKIEKNDLLNVQNIVDEMLEDGMKVLAIAYKAVAQDEKFNVEDKDLTLLGYLTFFDAPKKSAAIAIEKLKALNVGIRVLTGDQKSVTVSICRRLKIDTSDILTGEQFDKLAEDEKALRIENTTIFAQLSPKQKVQIVSILQDNGHTVGFLGDGMNDLPAIIDADVGICVDHAVEAVRENADVILLKKDLDVLEKGVLEGRKAFANMSKYIKITASSNFGNILSIVVASIFLPFLPISAIQILLLNLLYDILCLVLPWDNVDKEVYSKPLEWSGRHLGRFMRFFGPISSLFDILTFVFLFYVLCPSLCGGDFASLARTDMQIKFIQIFQTGWFVESMWTQVLILHLLRTRKSYLLESKPSWPVILVTTLGICLFTILIFTPIGSLIGLTALPINYFLFLIIVVILYLFFITLAKKWYLKKYQEFL